MVIEPGLLLSIWGWWPGCLCAWTCSCGNSWSRSSHCKPHAQPEPGACPKVSGFSLSFYFPGTGAGVLTGRQWGASGHAHGIAEKFFLQREAHGYPGSSHFKPARRADACPPLHGTVGALITPPVCPSGSPSTVGCYSPYASPQEPACMPGEGLDGFQCSHLWLWSFRGMSLSSLTDRKPESSIQCEPWWFLLSQPWAPINKAISVPLLPSENKLQVTSSEGTFLSTLLPCPVPQVGCNLPSPGNPASVLAQSPCCWPPPLRVCPLPLSEQTWPRYFWVLRSSSTFRFTMTRVFGGLFSENVLPAVEAL